MADVDEMEIERNEEEEMKKEDDSESSDSSDDSEDDEELWERISQLQTEVEKNPYNYNPHVELITLLRKDADLEKLRDAREKMSGIFPLTETLWLDWLRDEDKIATSDSDRQALTNLFERAVKDYLSVDLWLEYVQFSIGQMGMTDGISNVRNVFERALTATSLHVVKGSIIWEAYREFENALLATMQPPDSSSSDTEYTEQRNRVYNLFKRQLNVPFLDMENTYQEFKEWLKDEVDSSVQSSYNKALAKLEAIKPFEEALLMAEAPRLTEYESYIDFELKSNDPSRIQCIFERALAENCLVPELWLKYVNYLETKLKIETVSLPVLERCVRNCPWAVVLWQKYLRAMERYNQPHEKIKELVDNALRAGFTQPEEFLHLWLSFLDYLRRRIIWEKSHDEELEELRTTFLRAHNHLIEYFGDKADQTGVILRYWARIEAYYCKNMTKSRELWNEIMLMGNNSHNYAMWLEYCNLERACGDGVHLRALYQKGIQVVSDWPESIGDAWINFERDEGSLEQWETANWKIEKRMKIVEEKREKEQNEDLKWKQQNKNKEQKKQQTKTSGKRKFDDSKNDDGFKIPNIPPSTGSGRWEHLSAEPKPKKTKISSSDSSTNQHGESVPHDSSKDDFSVFLSNLNFNVTEEEIKEFFGKIGEIAELRLVKDFKGRSKGYAYLQYKKKDSVQEALKKDRELIGGRPVFVSVCEDKKKQTSPTTTTTTTKLKFSTGLEKNKLFVRGLAVDVTKDELTELFKPYGELNDVRIVTYKNGRPKGLAFIDYKTEQSAASAQTKLDGFTLKNKVISVAISCPPDRQGSGNKVYLGGRSGDNSQVGSRGRGRTQVCLVPRAILRSKGNEASSSQEKDKINGSQNGNCQIVKPKSNDEFRNLLL